MDTKIKMIGLDLDGTVLNDQKEVSPRVAATIQKAIEAGIVVLPATGRQLSGIPKEIFRIPGVRYALTSNGAKITDVQLNKTVYADCFEKKDILPILKYVCTLEAVNGVYLNDKGFGEPLSPEARKKVPPLLLEYIQNTRVTVDSLFDFVQNSEELVEKITLLFFEEELRKQALDYLSRNNYGTLTWAVPMGIEINTPSANKGNGLLALGRLLGIEKEEIMAIGDGHNDIEMLKTVGYAVAMENAEEEVKAVADFITSSCNMDGVANAIEKVL